MPPPPFFVQLPLFTNINNSGGAHLVNQPDFPNFPLPPQPTKYATVLDEEATRHVNTLNITQSDTISLECDTREQNKNPLWYIARSGRLTASIFKRICSRKSDHQQLVAILKKDMVQTKAMKRGVAMEPIAAAQYAEVTGNVTLPCGLVVNPHSPHLGASPDRKVIDKDNSYGLLEIKCPSRQSFELCPCLCKQTDGTYKLKNSHAYHYQIMGQLGLTGMGWCDLFIQCIEDYHLERIYFDSAKWEEMKVKLDVFFFNFYIN